MKKIIFTPIFAVDKNFYPEPALKNIPEWYKKTHSFTDKKFKVTQGQHNITIKKCLPVFDALSAGYIIKTYVDIFVEQLDGYPFFNWPMNDPIKFHALEQAPYHPNQKQMSYPKWVNPWSIETERGYSCLFVPPMHHENDIFTILPGIVDTDQYINPVNFPFVLNDKNFEGMIPAGTPMAQVIPFKRDSFKYSIGNDKNKNKVNIFSSTYMNKFMNNYKTKFWHRKEYK